MLTVVNVAYPLAPVGPDAAGGAEQVLGLIDRALVAAGHRSRVVALDGSVVAGVLHPVPHPAGPLIDDAARRAAQQAVRAQLRDASHGADLVHLHGLDFGAYLPRPGPPVLATLHLPPDWYPADTWRLARPRTWLLPVSEAQARTCPEAASLLPPIANGVPLDALASAPHARRGFALVLGRICPEKGQHLALEAAHRADVPLLVAGPAFPYATHLDYLDREVRPRLDRRRRLLGPLGLARKRRFLAAASCLVVPSLAAETSSLVAMEALACGTPVIARPVGALPDIVRHGVTGFLADDAAAIADALGRVGAIDPASCREDARRRFDARRMTDEHLALYARLVAA